MSNQIFADGISRIRVLNGIVRLDFASSAEAPQEQPALETQVRVVMSVQGFVEAYNTMQRAMAALVESGVLAKPAKKAVAPAPSVPVGETGQGPQERI